MSSSPHHIQCALQLFSPSPSFFLPSPCALTVNVEPGSKDPTALVPSFLLAYMFTKDWNMENIGTD